MSQPDLFAPAPDRVTSPRFVAQTAKAPKTTYQDLAAAINAQAPTGAPEKVTARELRGTRVEKVAQHFRRNPMVWVDSDELARLGGKLAWRTRVSNCRKKFGMHIENQQTTMRNDDGSEWTKSEYRYVPNKGA